MHFEQGSHNFVEFLFWAIIHTVMTSVQWTALPTIHLSTKLTIHRVSYYFLTIRAEENIGWSGFETSWIITLHLLECNILLKNLYKYYLNSHILYFIFYISLFGFSIIISKCSLNYIIGIDVVF